MLKMTLMRVLMFERYLFIIEFNVTLGNRFSSLQGLISNILEENVVQPLLVSVSAIRLATETVRSILKIDDIVSVRNVRIVK